MMDESILNNAYEHSIHNRDEIDRSNWCGCFYCGETFPAEDVVEWVKNENTAICPKCSIDAVIGDASGLLLHEEFFRMMYAKYFSYGIELRDTLGRNKDE
jgi:NAD-dependent SIR2 family protein deacetylase